MSHPANTPSINGYNPMTIIPIIPGIANLNNSSLGLFVNSCVFISSFIVSFCAVFGAAASFDGQQGGKLDFARVEILAVDFGGLVNEVEEGKSEQGFDIAFFPITRGRMRLALGLTAQGDGRDGHSVFFLIYSGAMTLTA